MKFHRWAIPALAIALLAALGSLPGSSQAQTDSRTFPETGKTVRGDFLTYWDTHGGLAQQGYPISDEFTEVSDLNDLPYTVQYFERAVFERHPENNPPYDVLLSQLGKFRYDTKYPQGAPGQRPNQTPDDSHYFAETQHWVGGAFWDYWQTHGGLAQQGYPISDEFTEVSDLNGKSYTVQYFERAVFEQHPENDPPYDVLLSQLGKFRYDAKYAAPTATRTLARATRTPVPATRTPIPASATATSTPVTAPAPPPAALCDNKPCWPPPQARPGGGNPTSTPAPWPTAACGVGNGGEIRGLLLSHGQPVAGLRIALFSKYDGQFAVTRTDSDGVYHFAGVQSSEAGNPYFINYDREPMEYRSGTLDRWEDSEFDYTACTLLERPPLELGDIQWTGACNGETRTLPTTITWIPRDPTERYGISMYTYSYNSEDGLGSSAPGDFRDLRDRVTLPAGLLTEPGMYAAAMFIFVDGQIRGEATRPCVFNIR